jgi:myo-inositol-1(or 4)-monophosphatase
VRDANSALRVAVAAAVAAGDLLRNEFDRGSRLCSEAGRDIKLEADVLAERAILARLRADAPHPVVSEEAGADEEADSKGPRWIVDPLDGTFNFSRRMPLCCVSIGLWDGDQPILGVVHEFVAGRTFRGIVGEGAWVDNRPLAVSAVPDPGRAALSTGFPTGRQFGSDALMAFVRQVQAYKKVRLIGSAALSLAYVAAGTLDAYHEEDIYFWDVAAGLALVKAAGGSFAIERGSRPWQLHVVATNGLLDPRRSVIQT